jgi:hypothetical protein
MLIFFAVTALKNMQCTSTQEGCLVRFQKMLQSSTRFYPVQAAADVLSFDLVPNPGLDIRTYRVAAVVETRIYTC